MTLSGLRDHARLAGIVFAVLLSGCGETSGVRELTPPHLPIASSTPAPSSTPFTSTVALPHPERSVAPVPASACSPALTTYAAPAAGAITSGPDGALWYTAAGALGRIATSGEVSAIPLAPGTSPRGIVSGPDGAIWFTDAARISVGRVGMDGRIAEYPLPKRDGNPMGAPDSGSTPTSIVAGPDGALWFTEQFGDRIGRITTQGEITQLDLPNRDRVHGNPEDIAVGPDGSLWVSQTLGQLVTRVDPANRTFSDVRVPDSSGEGLANPASLTATARHVWFAQIMSHTIVRLMADGTATHVKLPTAGAAPEAVAAGAGDDVWVLEGGGNRLARITAAGDVTEYPVLSDHDALKDARPNGITHGPDGAMWFTMGRVAKIGRFGCPAQ